MVQTFVAQQNRTVLENRSAIRRQSRRIGLIHHDEHSGSEFWDTLEDIRENVLDKEGQCISLDLADPLMESFPEMLYAALKNAHWEQSLSFSLPAILQHNPHAAPFVNQAISWQRLCDMLIVDDEPNRETVLILENVDLASSAVQHEVTRLIRFHQTHAIARTFIFTLCRYSHDQIIPELREIFAER